MSLDIKTWMDTSLHNMVNFPLRSNPSKLIFINIFNS